jgi:hypothetical protein
VRGAVASGVACLGHVDCDCDCASSYRLTPNSSTTGAGRSKAAPVAALDPDSYSVPMVERPLTPGHPFTGLSARFAPQSDRARDPCCDLPILSALETLTASPSTTLLSAQEVKGRLRLRRLLAELQQSPTPRRADEIATRRQRDLLG